MIELKSIVKHQGVKIPSFPFLQPGTGARGESGFRRKASPFFYQPESTSAFSHWLNVRVSLFINNQFINNTVF